MVKVGPNFLAALAVMGGVAANDGVGPPDDYAANAACKNPATWLAITDTYGVMRPIPSQIKGLSLSIVAVALPASHTPAAISVLFVCLTKCFRIQISRKQLDSGICVYDREALGTPLCKNQPSAAYFSYYLRFQQGCSWL